MITYTIINIDDNYQYEKTYIDLQEAIDTIAQYEKDDLQTEQGTINWYQIEDNNGNKVYDSLDIAEKILTNNLK